MNRPFAVALLALPVLLSAPLSAKAEPSQLALVAPYSFQPIPGVPAGGFLQLTARNYDDRLLAVRSPVAGEVQIHQTTVNDQGIASMRRIDSLALPAGQTVTLAPGGLHLMFIGLTDDYAPGDRIPVTLTFEAAGDVDTSFKVFARGTKVVAAALVTDAERSAAGPGAASPAPSPAAEGGMMAQMQQKMQDMQHDMGALGSKVGEGLTELKGEAGELIDQAGSKGAALLDRAQQKLESAGQALDSAKQTVGEEAEQLGEEGKGLLQRLKSAVTGN